MKHLLLAAIHSYKSSPGGSLVAASYKDSSILTQYIGRLVCTDQIATAKGFESIITEFFSLGARLMLLLDSLTSTIFASKK